MALEPVFRELLVSLHRLDDALKSLHVTMADKPENRDVAMADDLEGAVGDVMGSLQDTLKSAGSALRAVGQPVANLIRARKELTICQDRFDRLDNQMSGNLMTYGKLKELERLGAERRGEWLHWTASVKQGIEECSPLLDSTRQSLVRCWQEMVDHLATMLSAR